MIFCFTIYPVYQTALNKCYMYILYSRMMLLSALLVHLSVCLSVCLSVWPVSSQLCLFFHTCLTMCPETTQCPLLPFSKPLFYLLFCLVLLKRSLQTGSWPFSPDNLSTNTMNIVWIMSSYKWSRLTVWISQHIKLCSFWVFKGALLLHFFHVLKSKIITAIESIAYSDWGIYRNHCVMLCIIIKIINMFTMCLFALQVRKKKTKAA